MPLDTRALWVDYANLLAGDRSTTNPAMTATEKAAIANEIYQWLYLALTPRVSYLSYAGFTHSDGTTVVADSALRLTMTGANTMDLVLTNIEEVFSVHWEGLVDGDDPETIEAAAQLEYLEHGEFLTAKAVLGNASAPRYVHWERLGVANPNTSSDIGRWRITVAPAKLSDTATGWWYFSVVCRRSLATPATDLSSASPLSVDGSVPELLPHETYLGARLTAYEIMRRLGGDPRWAERVVRNVPASLMRSFLAARGMGELSVSSAT